MATIIKQTKAATVNPLKMSPSLGACAAFLGIKRCMPVMHGTQGCASLGLVLLGRHFREPVLIQTTAINEVTSILGDIANLEQAILNIRDRTKAELIAVCSTALTETRGDDVAHQLKIICMEHPEVEDTALLHAATPDYSGAFQDGWEIAILALVKSFVPRSEKRNAKQVNVLAGCHLMPADLEELREIIESFGLHPIILPDIADSLDGHIPEVLSATSMGGVALSEVATMGESIATLVIGRQMLSSAIELEERTGVPYTLFDRLTGLEANDRLLMQLSELSGEPVPQKHRRQRSQLQDAMVDAHFPFGGKKVAIAAEPDLLWALSNLLVEMGCTIECAVTTTDSPLLENMPTDKVLIGDLEDLENGAKAKGCDLLVTHSHGRQAAARLDIPFYRAGLPMFDRLGAGHELSIGYRGTRRLIFDVGNVFLANVDPALPELWSLPETTLRSLTETV